MHGVLSWVPQVARDKLLALCGEQLAQGGLLYINYNTKPGWNIRGMVRDFLIAQTAHLTDLSDLAARTQLAQEVAATAAAALTGLEHPYAQLMKREYDFVCQGHPSYIAHEFLAPHNYAYWRSEVRELGAVGLHYVADADFNYELARMPQELGERIVACGWSGMPTDDVADLFSYRQLHSAIFARTAPEATPVVQQLKDVFIASSLVEIDDTKPGESLFRHASGYEVSVTAEPVRGMLRALLPHWPRGERLGEALPGADAYAEDLLLLHRHNLIDLRLVEPEHSHPDPRLASFEEKWGGYVTDPYHRHEVLEAGRNRCARVVVGGSTASGAGCTCFNIGTWRNTLVFRVSRRQAPVRPLNGTCGKGKAFRRSSKYSASSRVSLGSVCRRTTNRMFVKSSAQDCNRR